MPLFYLFIRGSYVVSSAFRQYRKALVQVCYNTAMIDDAKNTLLKQKVAEHSSNPNFRHHQWFVQYHLEIVEKIAHELCQLYPEADKQYVDTLLWLHDYEKIVDFDDQYNTELEATKTLMAEVGYSPEVIAELRDSLNIYNAKQDLRSAKIEIQIVSSADGASHLVGPFCTLYWYENPGKGIADLQSDNRKKFSSDWEAKITLPEVKQAFETRHRFALEVAGELPTSFLIS